MDERLLFKVAAIGVIAAVAACDDSSESTAEIPSAQQDSGLDASAGFDSDGSSENVSVPDAAEDPQANEAALPTRRCAGNVPQSYDPPSGWQDGTYCAHQLCVYGECVGECTPGEFQCTGSSPSACSSDGLWTRTSLQTDPHNCGECGHDCLGGGCLEGACLPIQVLGSGSIGDIAVNDTHVYWTTGSCGRDMCSTTIHVSPSNGSGAESSFDAVDCPVALAADEESVYWIAVSDPGGRWRVNKARPDGSDPVRLASCNRAEMIAVHKGVVTWAESSETASRLYQVSAAGGEVRKTWWGMGIMLDLAVADRGIVVATYNAITNYSHVTRIDPGGEDASVLATEPGYISAITADETTVYYVKRAEGTLSKVPLDGGTVVELARELTEPSDVLVDLAAVYVLESDKVLRLWLSGGVPELVARVGGPRAVVHRDHIYAYANLVCSCGCVGEFVRLVK